MSFPEPGEPPARWDPLPRPFASLLPLRTYQRVVDVSAPTRFVAVRLVCHQWLAPTERCRFAPEEYPDNQRVTTLSASGDQLEYSPLSRLVDRMQPVWVSAGDLPPDLGPAAMQYRAELKDRCISLEQVAFADLGARRSVEAEQFLIVAPAHARFGPWVLRNTLRFFASPDLQRADASSFYAESAWSTVCPDPDHCAGSPRWFEFEAAGDAPYPSIDRLVDRPDLPSAHRFARAALLRAAAPAAVEVPAHSRAMPPRIGGALRLGRSIRGPVGLIPQIPFELDTASLLTLEGASAQLGSTHGLPYTATIHAALQRLPPPTAQGFHDVEFIVTITLRMQEARTRWRCPHHGAVLVEGEHRGIALLTSRGACRHEDGLRLGRSVHARLPIAIDSRLRRTFTDRND